jgi:hypothetical protein
MATVTFTETGVALQVGLTRSELGNDFVHATAVSITDSEFSNGRVMRNYDLTPTLTAPQLAMVKSVLDFVESKVKAQWNIA